MIILFLIIISIIYLLIRLILYLIKNINSIQKEFRYIINDVISDYEDLVLLDNVSFVIWGKNND